MKPKEKLRNYIDSRSMSETTKQRYEYALSRIASTKVGIKNHYNVDELRSILAELRRSGCESNSMRFYYYFLKTYQKKIQKEDWPLKEGDRPKKEEEPNKPIFTEKELKEFIRLSKENAKPTDLLLLVFSSTYGVRRVELADLTNREKPIGADTVEIKGRKGGMKREHTIPPEIKSWIRELWFEPGLKDYQVKYRFRRLEKACGLEHGWIDDGDMPYGWHAIRRRIATSLNNRGVDDDDLFTFMRWKQEETILDQYIVRTKKEKEEQQREVDEKIFEVHPFLEVWEN